MKKNADFQSRASVINKDNEWLPSPMPGVHRKMLDRIGDEVARATTIVRYAPGSQFSEHTHTGGEEFIVLEGVFQDQSGDFPAGSYVRNPPQSAHTPSSKPGCIIFVKLWQFDMTDRTPVHLNMNDIALSPDTARPGVKVGDIYSDDRETVRVEEWEAGTISTIETNDGAEILVLSGSLSENGETLQQHDWLRLPDGYTAVLKAGETGVKIWLKTGHLKYVIDPADILP